MSRRFVRDDTTHDVVGIGFGPANLALAIALGEETSATMRFLERQPEFGWHRGMLIDDATMQVSFLKDLVTMRNPTSDFSFVSFLHRHGRLVDFINYKTLFPLRVEFHDYFAWAASRLEEHVDYGHEVVDVRPQRGAGGRLEGFDVISTTTDGGTVCTQARNVVVAAGLTPVVPVGVERGERVWHNAELVPRVAALQAAGARPRRFVVIGAGQSAAEGVAHLHREFPTAEVCSVFSRYGYSPADDSPFANRIFDPEAAARFHAAPPGVKDALMAYHRNTNYSVVDAELIEQLYRDQYRERVLGRERLRMMNVSIVRELRVEDGHVDVEVETLDTGARERLNADAVVFATGYRPSDPLAVLGEAGALCARDDDGNAVVRRDHSLELTVPSDPGLYVQGATEHAFGLTSTLLSMVAVRAAEIAAAVAAGPPVAPPAAAGAAT